MGILIANILTLIVNAVLLSACLKLYTEYFKDRSSQLTRRP